VNPKHCKQEMWAQWTNPQQSTYVVVEGNRNCWIPIWWCPNCQAVKPRRVDA
jgi:hypothetical protein